MPSRASSQQSRRETDLHKTVPGQAGVPNEIQEASRPPPDWLNLFGTNPHGISKASAKYDNQKDVRRESK